MLPVTRHSIRLANPFATLREELDRVFGDVMPNAGESYGAFGSYPVDIREDENHLYVEAEMPGFKREEVEITLENGVLTISGERRQQTDAKGEHHLHERRFTRVLRRFSLPNTVDENQVSAKLDSGVLHLTLNKREEVKPRKIEVK